MHMIRIVACAAAALAGLSAFAGDEVYVAMNGVDAEGRGGSDAPFASVAYAVSSLGADGGTVWVGEGTFASATLITVTTPVRIVGLGASPSDTEISGSGTSSRVIKIANASAALENVTVCNGYFTNAKVSDGVAPGLTLTAGLVSNCVVTACTGLRNWTQFASVYQTGGLIVDCVISDGRLPDAASEQSNDHALGAYLAGSARMERCLFKDFNHADARGYVVYLNSASAVLSKCTVVDSCVKYRRTCPGYGIYANAGTVSGCAIIGVRRAGSTIGGVYYAPQIAPWGGNADCFVNCATDGEDPINESCFVVASDCAFRDYTSKDYTPAPGSVLAAHGIGRFAYTKTMFDAAFGVDRYVGPTGSEFVFTATSASASGPVTYQWDFDGDGTYDTEPSASATVSHAYMSSGTFSPVLKASDGSTVLEIPRTDLVTVAPAVIYVDAKSADPVAPYTDPTTAAKTIADAVAVAEDGSEIRVAKGLYAINVNDGAFRLTKGVRIIGQGAPSEVIVSNSLASGNHRFMASIDHPDALVANLCFQKGDFSSVNESQYSGLYAAGITIFNNGGTVSNCIITACIGRKNQNYSGALQLSAGLVTDCIVEKCGIDNGAAHTYIYKGMGALFLGAGTVENTLFRDFASTYFGHIVWMQDAGAKLENCTFVNSTLGSYGSSVPCNAIYAPYGTVRNCVVYGVGRIAVGSTPATDDASWSGKAENFANCATPGVYESFVTVTDKDFADYVNGDYTPAFKGALQDAGGEYSGVSSIDLAGNQRVCGDCVDIGAYEYQSGGFSAQILSSISIGTAPVSVEFTALVEGASGTLTYDWDFNGDGVYEVESLTTSSVVNIYDKAGSYDVGLRVHDSDVTDPLVVIKQNCLTLAPSLIYVNAACEEPIAPYDDPMHAATSIVDGVSVGLAGSTVSVAPGIYKIKNPISITDGVRVVGESGDPDDVLIWNTETVSGENHSLFTIDHADALVANVTMTNGYIWIRPGFGAGATIGTAGGTISNCVVVGCTARINQDHCGGVYLKNGLLTHSVIKSCRALDRQYFNGTCKAGGAAAEGQGRIENSLFCGFTSESKGPVVWIGSANASIVNCTVVDSVVECYQPGHNTAFEPAAGIYCPYGTVCNCAVFGVSRIAFESYPATEFAAWGGTASKFDHCATDGEEAINESCYIADKTKDVRNYANGDYRPAGGGALVNHGVMPPNVPSVDLSGGPRVFDKFIDIGCYECTAGGLLLIVR